MDDVDNGVLKLDIHELSIQLDDELLKNITIDYR